MYELYVLWLYPSIKSTAYNAYLRIHRKRRQDAYIYHSMGDKHDHRCHARHTFQGCKYDNWSKYVGFYSSVGLLLDPFLYTFQVNPKTSKPHFCFFYYIIILYYVASITNRKCNFVQSRNN